MGSPGSEHWLELLNSPLFSVGKEGRAAGRNFKHSATLSQAGISQEPRPWVHPARVECRGNLGPLRIWAGSSPLLEILGPVPLGYSTSVCWLGARHSSPSSAQLSSLPRTLELLLPRARVTPARSGHCTCVPTPCQGCSTAMGI